MRKLVFLSLMVLSCNVSRINIIDSEYISDHNHLGSTVKLILKNTHFYYFENGMFYSQGNVETIKKNQQFILTSDQQLANPYRYSESGRDSLKELMHSKNGAPIVNGFVPINQEIMYMKRGKLYFKGYVFHNVNINQ